MHCERLRAAGDLQADAGPALRRPDRARVEGQPVDLVLERAGDTTVHLRAHPDVTLAPLREGS